MGEINSCAYREGINISANFFLKSKTALKDKVY